MRLNDRLSARASVLIISVGIQDLFQPVDIQRLTSGFATRVLVRLTLVRDHLRGVRLRPRAEIDVTELPAAEAPSDAEQREISARTKQALSQLRPAQRAVVELHWLEERPFPEVAATLGERLSTVKVRAHRAYRELRRVLA